MRRGITVLSFAGVLGAAACVSLAGLREDAPPASSEAGTDGPAPMEAAAPADPCRHAVPPDVPVADDDPSGAVPSFVVAVRETSVTGKLDGGVARGFDLDGVCSCFADPSTAHAAAGSCLPAREGGTAACDDVGGVDRQLAVLLAPYPDFFSGVGNTGGPTLLLKIAKYNGRANDKDVLVAFVASPGIYDDRACADAGVDGGSPPYSPTWRGCDHWTIDPAYVLPGSIEPLAFLPAYVADHVLVLRPTTKPTTFVAGNAALAIENTVMTARLVAVDAQQVPILPAPQVGKAFRLEDGVVAGRIATKNLLQVFASSQAAVDGGPLCGFPNFFNTVKHDFLCPGADIAHSMDLDFTSAPCDAISVATAFRAEPALFGDRRSPNMPRCKDPKAPDVQPFFDCAK